MQVLPFALYMEGVKRFRVVPSYSSHFTVLGFALMAPPSQDALACSDRMHHLQDLKESIMTLSNVLMASLMGVMSLSGAVAKRDLTQQSRTCERFPHLPQCRGTL